MISLLPSIPTAYLWYSTRKFLLQYMSLNEKVKQQFSLEKAVASGSYLSVVDHRTNRTYTIPIENNSIPASAFKNIKAAADTEYPPNQDEDGIRVFDNGFVNTAVMKSSITYV